MTASSTLPRVIGWVSAGAASAVACKLAIAKYGIERVELKYIDTGSEHSDSERFLIDLEAWFGKPIERLRSDKFADTWAVWEKERFLRSPQGAPCTRAMKFEVRFAADLPLNAIQIWGFTVEERDRAKTFKKHHGGEMVCEFPLIDEGLGKSECYALIDRAGIALPIPYLLGFHNNNCIPCTKAEGAKYWNRIRRHFPGRFARMAALSRSLNYALVRVTRDKVKISIFLDELDPNEGWDDDTPEPMSCGITCFIAELNMEPAT